MALVHLSHAGPSSKTPHPGKLLGPQKTGIERGHVLGICLTNEWIEGFYPSHELWGQRWNTGCPAPVYVGTTLYSLCIKIHVEKLKNIQKCENFYKSWFLDPINRPCVSLEHSYTHFVHCLWLLFQHVDSARGLGVAGPWHAAAKSQVNSEYWLSAFRLSPELLRVTRGYCHMCDHGPGNEQSGDCLLFSEYVQGGSDGKVPSLNCFVIQQ